jgi:hypothetical protein
MRTISWLNFIFIFIRNYISGGFNCYRIQVNGSFVCVKHLNKSKLIRCVLKKIMTLLKRLKKNIFNNKVTFESIFRIILERSKNGFILLGNKILLTW